MMVSTPAQESKSPEYLRDAQSLLVKHGAQQGDQDGNSGVHQLCVGRCCRVQAQIHQQIEGHHSGERYPHNLPAALPVPLHVATHDGPAKWQEEHQRDKMSGESQHHRRDVTASGPAHNEIASPEERRKD
jgi:hypothetical protein